MSVSSANPATPYTRAEFFNACTSVLEGLTCVQRQHCIIDETSWDVLNQLGRVVSDLRPEVNQNREYWVDGPLVRFLTANILKAKSVLQEMKRTCSQKCLAKNGPEFVERHVRQHIADIKTALEELETYHQNLLYSRNTMGIDSGVQQRMSATQQAPMEMTASGLTTNPLPEFNTQPQGADTFMKTMQDSKANETSASQPATSGNTTASGWTSESHDPVSSKPGVFEHISEVTNNYPEHDPNWPKHDRKPNLPFERTYPPLVHPGLRDVHNYRNLPQFTGKNLPMPKIPDGEMGLRAPHVPHWDSTNHYAY